MRLKLTKLDRIFLAALSAGLLLHFMLLFSFPYLHDEYFYATIPYRLLQGDSLFRQEWHLSQLSSLFTFLPVSGWIGIRGSADGLLLFLRCLYLTVHTAVAVVTYLHFRKNGKWAIAAVLLFFTQTPYRILSLNYNSLYAICTLLLTLCLHSISDHPSSRTSFAAGLCIGCCCVCNPLFAGLYLLYLLLYFLRIAGKRHKDGSFFRRETMAFSLLGVCSVAFITIAYFFLTGGSVVTTLRNLPLILGSSEYFIGTDGLLLKLHITYQAFSSISFDMPLLLPIMYLCMLADPKRYTCSHRCLYLLLSLVASVGSVVGILLCFMTNYIFPMCMFFSLPLVILTTTCYILTEHKNRQLFFCMWLPSVIAACVQYMASNTMLTALGFVLAVANVAGVLFARDLYREMTQDADSKVYFRRLGKGLICGGLCLQLLFHLFVCVCDQMPEPNSFQLKAGPCAGMYLSESEYDAYNNTISDLDYIRAETPEDAPLLIVSYYSWMYLYAQRPIATYTTWFEITINRQNLINYYVSNPEKIPQYIYVDAQLYEFDENMELLTDLFEFRTEVLSQGVLLEVEGCKFR